MNKSKKEDIIKEVLEPKQDVIREVLETSAPTAVEVDATQVQEEKPKKKKTGVVIATVCISVVIVAALIGVAALTTFSQLNKKAKEPTKKAEIEKTVPESAYRISGNGLEDFDLYFLQLENNKQNIVYSPLSIKYTLAMLNEGTDGRSHEQIKSIIGDYNAKKYNNNAHMSFANAMFVRNTIKNSIKEDYTKTLQEKYNAEVITDSFESAKPMNDWVSNKTFNLINNLLPDYKVQDANFILMNALAIDMNWVNRIQAASAPLPEGMSEMHYHVSYIHEDYGAYIGEIQADQYPSMTFNGEDDTKSVKVGASFNHYDIVKELGEDKIRDTVTNDYKKYLEENPQMAEECPTVEEYVNQYIKDIDTNYGQAAESTDYSIYVDDDVKLFAKNLQTYEGTTLQYIGIMPRKVELSTYIDGLKASDLTKTINKLKEVKYDNFKEGVVTQIEGNIPLFKYEADLNLQGDLIELGVKDVFDAKKADLSKISKGKYYIGDASHKALIEFSNDGIKAAAVTSMTGVGSSMPCNYDYRFDVPVEKIDVTFDKPYLYIIRDKATGEVWFTGAVYSPDKNEKRA